MPSDNSQLTFARTRIFGSLFVSQSLFTTAMIVSFTLTPIIAVSLSGSESAAGLPSTLSFLGRAAAAYPLGWLMGNIGRRNGLSAGYVLGVAGAAISIWAILSNSWWAFLLGALLLGMMRGSAEQGRFVAAEVFPAGRRAGIIGIIVTAGTIGSVFGPLLVIPAGQLALAWEMPEAAGPFILATALMLVALLVTFLFLRPDPSTLAAEENTVPESTPEKDGSAPSLRQIYRRPGALLALIAMVVGQLVMTLIMVITPVHMDHLNHATGEISVVIMAHTLGMFGLSFVNGFLVQRFGRRMMIAAGALVLVTACILVPVSATVLMLSIALFMLGLGWNICYVAGSALLSESTYLGERGRAQGSSETIVALAAGTGSLSTGLVFAAGGMVAVGAVGLALALFLAVMLFFSPAQKPASTPTALP